LKKKIRVAFIYNPRWDFYTGRNDDNNTYYFFFNALKRNSKLDVSYFPAENSFDYTKLRGKFDIILITNESTGLPNRLIGIQEIDIPVLAVAGEFFNPKKIGVIKLHEKYKINYYFNFMHEDFFYKFYPKDFKYKTVISGLEPSLYQNIKPFKERIKKRIINSG